MKYIALLLLCFALFSTQSAASTVHQVQLSNACTASGANELVNNSSSDGSTVSGTAGGTSSTNGCSTTGAASAGPGYLGADVSTDVVAGTESRGYGGAISSNLSSRYAGISLTTPAGYAGGPVATSLSFDYSAFIGGTTADVSIPGLFDSFVRFTVSVSVGSTLETFDSSFSVGDPGPGDCPSPGCSQSISGTFTTPTFDWDPIQTMVVTLGLNGASSALAYFGGTASSDVLASSTLSFASVNAFDLPTGFSVSHADAGIVANNWVDPRGDPTPSPVPLPAGFPLLLAALGGLALISRRKVI